MTKAIWACAIGIFLILLVEWGNYTMNHDIIYGNIPQCKPAKEEGIVS